MKDKKLLMKYITEIWDTGEIVNTPIFVSEKILKQESTIEEGHYINLDVLSQRIAQVLAVIKLAYRYNEEKGKSYMDRSLSKAVADTAEFFDVSVSSISDKCTRQMKYQGGSLKMQEFKDMVRRYLINDDGDILKSIIINNSIKSDNEKKAIDMFFENPDIPFILHGKPF